MKLSDIKVGTEYAVSSVNPSSKWFCDGDIYRVRVLEIGTFNVPDKDAYRLCGQTRKVVKVEVLDKETGEPTGSLPEGFRGLDRLVERIPPGDPEHKPFASNWRRIDEVFTFAQCIRQEWAEYAQEAEATARRRKAREEEGDRRSARRDRLAVLVNISKYDIKVYDSDPDSPVGAEIRFLSDAELIQVIDYLKEIREER